MNEDDSRAFDDEDAFAILMDYEKYDENGFPSLLLGPNEETNIIEKEQQQQQQHELTATIGDVFLPDAPEPDGGADVHLPRFRDGDYVRINPRYFYPSPERWPSGNIVSTERARGGGGDNTISYEVEIVSDIYESRDENVGTITIPEKHIEMYYEFDYEEGEDPAAGGNDHDHEMTDEVLVLGDDGREAILNELEHKETNGIEVGYNEFTADGTKKWLYPVNFMREADNTPIDTPIDAKEAVPEKILDAKEARLLRKRKLDAKRNAQGDTNAQHRAAQEAARLQAQERKEKNEEFRRDLSKVARRVGVALKHNESIQNGSVSIPQHSSRGLSQCKYCSAVLLKEERHKSWCCHHGKIRPDANNTQRLIGQCTLEEYMALPLAFKQMYNEFIKPMDAPGVEDDPLRAYYKKFSYMLNNQLAFASAINQTARRQPNRNQSSTTSYNRDFGVIRWNGEIVSTVSGVKPDENPTFAQIYALDPTTRDANDPFGQFFHRLKYWPLSNESNNDYKNRSYILGRLQEYLNELSPHAKRCHNLRQVFANQEDARVNAGERETRIEMETNAERDIVPPGAHVRNYSRNETEQFLTFLLDDTIIDDKTGMPFTMITKSFIQWRLPPEGGEATENGEQLQQEGKRLKEIYMTNAHHDGLRYPLLNPLGHPQWSWDIKSYANWPRKTKETQELYDEGRYDGKRVSCSAYTTYHFFDRPNQIPLVQNAGMVYQSWLMKQFVMAEDQKLQWIKAQQEKLKASQYAAFRRSVDTMTNEQTRNDPNKRPIIIPATLIGGPRFMNEAFYKGMALVKEFGKPDFFITMTTNPQWPEILQLLSPGQTPGQRPDVVTRVFRLKLDAMIEDITKNHVLGEVTAWCYAVEYQQRGYPHAHVNVWMKNKMKSGDDVDSIISAELPPEENPRLREAVKKFNIHGVKQFGCCGIHGAKKLSCCVNGKCTKDFPKKYSEISQVVTTDEDGNSIDDDDDDDELDDNDELNDNDDKNSKNDHNDDKNSKNNPHANVNFTYRRRKNVNETDDGYKNTNVVPYNPYLTLKYDCHVNVEAVCGGLATIKYMVKYLTKSARGDRNMVAADEIVRGDDDGEFKRLDEIREYKDMRSIQAFEACDKMLHGTRITCFSHAVKVLPVHLPNETVLENALGRLDGDDNDDDAREEDEEQQPPPPQQQQQGEQEDETAKTKSALDGFFEFNAKHSDANVPYWNMHRDHVWDSKKREWRKRLTRRKSSFSIGRLRQVNFVHEKETYFLRMLLAHKKHSANATSFQSLKTINGVAYETFHEACVAMGLASDDREVYANVREAATVILDAKQLREFVVTMLEMIPVKCINEVVCSQLGAMTNDYLQEAATNALKEKKKNESDPSTTTATPSHHGIVTKEEMDLRRIMLQLEITAEFKKKLSTSRFKSEQGFDLKSIALTSMGTAGALFDSQKSLVALCEKHLNKVKSAIRRRKNQQQLSSSQQQLLDIDEMNDTSNGNDGGVNDDIQRFVVVLRNGKDLCFDGDGAYATERTTYGTTQELKEIVEKNVSMMNEGQKSAFKAIVASIPTPSENNNNNNNNKKLFFMDAPAGTGKTYLLNTVLAHARSLGHIAIAVASSGVAGMLLSGGSTFHSRTKAPLFEHRREFPIPSERDEMYHVWREAEIIVWDESVLMHKSYLDRLDEFLQEIMYGPSPSRGQRDEQRRLPFGGKTIVLAGDFRQGVPVVEQGSHVAIMQATLLHAKSWDGFQILELSENMRLKRAVDEAKTEEEKREINDFGTYIKTEIGEGEGNLPQNDIIADPNNPTRGLNFVLPPNICHEYKNNDDVVEKTFGPLFRREEELRVRIIPQLAMNSRERSNANEEHERCVKDINGSCVLAPLNRGLADLNATIVNQFRPSTSTQILYSSDELHQDSRNDTLRPDVEYLNKLNPGGIPPHSLAVKEGMKLILLRNLDVSRGLSNGTQLILKKVILSSGTNNEGQAFLLLCENPNATNERNKTVMLFRMPMEPKQNQFNFRWMRTQFPVAPAFAMTISKSQGQTIPNNVSVLLKDPIFSHGSLYVAMSRVTDPKNLKLFLPNRSLPKEHKTYTKNVVYKDLLMKIKEQRNENARTKAVTTREPSRDAVKRRRF